MADEAFPFYSDGPNYRCRRCDEELPDGATVLGNWRTDGALLGVRVEFGDGEVVHECGITVATPPDVETPTAVASYLEQVQTSG